MAATFSPAAASSTSLFSTTSNSSGVFLAARRPITSLSFSSSFSITNASLVLQPSAPPVHTHHTFSSKRRSGGLRAEANAFRSSEEVRELVLPPFSRRCAFKVIAGLQNFNSSNVADTVLAAYKGGATHVDIACKSELVRMAVQLSPLPVCVSSVEPELFVDAVAAGAHMVEIGNYDSFYESGRTFSASEVLELTRRTRRYLPTVVISVTVPHTLSLDAQIELAEALEAEGVDIIQTEGGCRVSPLMPGIHGLIEKASPTLAAAYAISRAVRIPVMCASGLSVVTVPMAIAAGASGVGVGSAVNKLNDQIAMIAAVRSIADALCLPSISSKSSASYSSLGH